MSKIAISAKVTIYKYCIFELKKLIKNVEDLLVPANYTKGATYINIAEGAYLDEAERDISFFTKWNKNPGYSTIAKTVVTLYVLDSLRKINYIAYITKDGFSVFKMGL